MAHTTSYEYVNDGVTVTVDKKGSIKGIIFYVVPSANIKKAADVKTQAGIGTGSSLREIVKTNGPPLKRTEDNLLGYLDTSLYYQFGSDVLSFRFNDGVLDSINMNKDYLPFLN